MCSQENGDKALPGCPLTWLLITRGRAAATSRAKGHSAKTKTGEGRQRTDKKSNEGWKTGNWASGRSSWAPNWEQILPELTLLSKNDPKFTSWWIFSWQLFFSGVVLWHYSHRQRGTAYRWRGTRITAGSLAGTCCCTHSNHSKDMIRGNSKRAGCGRGVMQQIRFLKWDIVWKSSCVFFSLEEKTRVATGGAAKSGITSDGPSLSLIIWVVFYAGGGRLNHGLAMEYPPCWGLQTHGPCHTCRIYRATCTTPCLSHFLRLYLLPFDSEPCENSGLPAAQKRSDICLKKHKRQGRTETWTSVLTDHKSPHKFDVIMNGVFFSLFFFHEGLSGRRRVAATLVFQQIPILRQQQKNERGLPAAFHQKPNRHEVQSQDGDWRGKELF